MEIVETRVFPASGVGSAPAADEIAEIILLPDKGRKGVVMNINGKILVTFKDFEMKKGGTYRTASASFTDNETGERSFVDVRFTRAFADQDALKKFSTSSWYLMEVAGFLAFDGGKPRLIIQQAKVEKSGEFQKKEEPVNHYEKAKKPAEKKPAPKPKKNETKFEEVETECDLPF